MQRLLLAFTLLLTVSINVAAGDDSSNTYKHVIDLVGEFNSAHAMVLNKHHEDMASGVTPRMASAIEAESDLIFEYLIPIESYTESKSVQEVNKAVSRDVEAIAFDQYIRGHLLGLGGTGVVTDVAETERDHLLNRLIYHVVRVHKQDEDSFELTVWLKALGIEIPEI